MTEIDNTAGTSQPAPPKNALFGKYELGRLLGCGAFAKVYYARDVRSGQSFAIKVFSKQKLNVHANLKSNMMREVAIMRRLRHPNIVRLFEVLASRTKIYFVLEFVKGGELFDKIVKGRFTEDLSRKYFQQLISAVSYCHSRGVYHRDLKPENLLIDENGDLKVSDFGLSALTDHVRQDGLLHTLCGTPAYVAPEVLSRKGYDGAKADVWSAGVILYVLAAGCLPFNDPNLMGMYKKIYSGEFKCPKWMSPELKQILARLLDTNPETRISMDEIKSDPWFRKDYKEVNSYDDEFEFCFDNSKEDDNKMPLTAFDIISFSSGLNLSGLFEESRTGTENGELLTVESSPERIVLKIEEIAKEQNMRAKRNKELGVEIEGQNGNFVLFVFVYRLTDRLAIVEAKQRRGDGGLYNELWNTKIRPVILGRRGEQIPGNQNSPAVTLGDD